MLPRLPCKPSNSEAKNVTTWIPCLHLAKRLAKKQFKVSASVDKFNAWECSRCLMMSYDVFGCLCILVPCTVSFSLDGSWRQNSVPLLHLPSPARFPAGCIQAWVGEHMYIMITSCTVSNNIMWHDLTIWQYEDDLTWLDPISRNYWLNQPWQKRTETLSCNGMQRVWTTRPWKK